MADVYNLSNMSNDYEQNNNYDNSNNNVPNTNNELDRYEDIGQDIFNTESPTDGSLSFFNLGIVHIDYVEMKRERDQIMLKGTSAIGNLRSLYNAMSELAGLVEYPLNTSGCESRIVAISKEFNYIKEEMTRQIELYTAQSDLTSKEIAELNNMVIGIISNPNLSYSNKYGDYTIGYNDALNKYKQQALLSSYSDVDIDYLLENCKTTNKAVDIYSYIENNLQEEMKDAGVTTGKEYLNLILDTASQGATTNREKAVSRALALNKFLGENGIAAKYWSGGGHGSYSIDNIASGSDCSSYASTLAMQGNSNFDAGWTGVLYNSNNTTALDINNILPGDIIVSHGNAAYEHARFVLGVDKVNNRIITTECGGYSGSGGYDVNNGGFSKSHVDSFDINTLISQGYRTNHVDYGDNYINISSSDDIIAL